MKCHYHNESSFCLNAARPKLIETQFVQGLSIYGGHDRQDNITTPLTLANSPFWTITPSYSEDIYIANLRILAPLTKIGNTDGCNLESCRNAVIKNLYIKNGDDGIALKSGLNGLGLEFGRTDRTRVDIDNITTEGRGGLAMGSEMSGGIRNVTVRNCRLLGERSIIFKPSVGRGGYMEDIRFENITTSSSRGVYFAMNHDGIPLLPDNHYVPLVSNIRFHQVTHLDGLRGFAHCLQANRSQCFNITADTVPKSPWPEILPLPRFFTCKTTAHTMFQGTIRLPWPVCIPLDAPVNLRPDYPNWGPTRGNFSSLKECQSACDDFYYKTKLKLVGGTTTTAMDPGTKNIEPMVSLPD
jgi:hypothetical protein